MSNSVSDEAYTFCTLVDRSDPIIEDLCKHIEALSVELARVRMINHLIEDQLAQLGITLNTDPEQRPDPEE